ncbi:hypothetical protein HUN01_09675 [Nostoc edaphicum CCNP1411]|uniref:Uncharacterized protein n=1 Tax=Nostoc edaphicum CCNP1411 TaxID=1472755 RepID=A0A7D7QD56_9NOSO|nr:hypothetical protein [Nostoc edaphicum]QMS87839.1 hypothetical protein HUN01_09675 [Nostoc edaphicum CCNP1411]
MNIVMFERNVAMFARTAFIFTMMDNKIAIANLFRLISDRTTNNSTSHLVTV